MSRATTNRIIAARDSLVPASVYMFDEDAVLVPRFLTTLARVIFILLLYFVECWFPFASSRNARFSPMQLHRHLAESPGPSLAVLENRVESGAVDVCRPYAKQLFPPPN